MSVDIAVDNNGATVRERNLVKTMQIIKNQRLDLEAKRKVADEAESVAMKEVRAGGAGAGAWAGARTGAGADVGAGVR